MRAAVIIPHYNDTLRLGRCLAALMVQDVSATEVVVVDNGSTESLSALVAAYPSVRFVTEPSKGAALARNRGVAETTAQHLFFLDCDCVPAPDWLAVAHRVAPRADLIGGGIDLFDETPPPRSGAQAFEAVFAFDYRRYIEEKGFAVTANLLTTREVFTQTGRFVPGLSEDLDWCHRARARGYRLICAEDLRVGHPSRDDWAALERKWLRLTREGFGVNGASPVSRAKWAAKALLMPLSILAHVPKILRSARLQGTRDRMAAIATLARLRARRAGWMLRQAAGLPV